jgi:hypothetical protein
MTDQLWKFNLLGSCPVREVDDCLLKCDGFGCHEPDGAKVRLP